MRARYPVALLLLTVALASAAPPGSPEEKLYKEPLNVNPPPISTDKSVKYDYDIVYVRARRAGDKVHKRFYTDIATPVTLEPGADLMLLHPDGSEELLVEGGEGAVTDPVVSFDGQSVYYTYIPTLKGAGPWQPPAQGADIYKIHVPTRKITRLTHQEFTPNTGAADWSGDCRKPEEGKTHLSYGVLNFGPCPLPGGRIVFTSNRNAFRPPRAYPTVALQLFVMDEDGGNVEQIGHLNIAGALHPVVLTDGRIVFSSLESQGVRGEILWGIWAIRPDGTRWQPVVSAFDPGGAPNAFHFQAQLSDGSVVVEEYYNQNNSGFGAYVKLPPEQPYPAFGPAHMSDARNKPWRFGRFDNGKGKWYRMPFMPVGSESLTPFALNGEGPADPSVLGDKDSPKVGKFTHPSGAPDNHLLTVYSPGPVNHQYTFLPQLDGGIYLLKDGKPISEPGQLLLIKNDPDYNEQWPRALVPYQRIYGIDEPKQLAPLANDGKRSPLLPEGTPFGLVGTSSLCKRESYPNGAVTLGGVTAAYAGGNDPWKGLDPFTSHGNGMPLNWHNQGADAGLYGNDDIHAVRILVMEPTTDRNRGPRSGRLFHSHAMERLRILGEIPVRKFDGDKQPTDPDGNPDTSFLARIPADTAFTFQTLDKDGMVLNMAQTWHQLRPGEIRNDCGGCHAHSQQPTPFERTAAAKPDYKVWDLINQTPLVTARAKDESGKKWDAGEETGLAFAKGVKSVEYFRDVKPILERSCVACHTKNVKEPAGNLVLDGDDEKIPVENKGPLPGTYYRLAMDGRAKFGYKPVGWDSWGYPQASRYVRMFQSRRSLLVWKVFGKRLDGFSNDDHPSEPAPGAGTLAWKGEPVDVNKFKARADLDYTGSVMPPPEAVAGTYTGPDGKKVKVEPLSDEDRRTLVRWIDLGCPIDLDHDPARPEARGYGWMCDDNRPTLTVTYPRAGANPELTRLLVGMHDYYTGLDMDTFQVAADFAVDGVPSGQNLAAKFKPVSQGVWELKLAKPITTLEKGRLIVSVKDRQGNVSRIERTFSVGAAEGR
jgi:Hydrazine synthase alpha subunit middle domain